MNYEDGGEKLEMIKVKTKYLKKAIEELKKVNDEDTLGRKAFINIACGSEPLTGSLRIMLIKLLPEYRPLFLIAEILAETMLLKEEELYTYPIRFSSLVEMVEKLEGEIAEVKMTGDEIKFEEVRE